MPTPVISLLTDFGLSDTYVGQMKAVILGRCPQAAIVDLTHDIPAQDVLAAGFALSSAWRYFPGGSIHIAVVDPGVGTDRQALVVYEDGQYFVGPDNGLFALAIGKRPEKVIAVKNKEFTLKSVSNTFHGRDIFAPVGAALAMGIPMDDIGDPVSNWVDAAFPTPRVEDNGTIHGEVIYIDHFGNLVTNIPGTQIPYQPEILMNNTPVTHLVKTYADAPPGVPLGLIGSSGLLEISVNKSNAAKTLNATVGASIQARQNLPDLD